MRSTDRSDRPKAREGRGGIRRIVTGPRAVLEALGRPGPSSLAVIYVDSEASRPSAQIAEAARAQRVPIEARDRQELDRLSGGLRHQGILAIAGEYTYRNLNDILDEAPRPALLIALDEVTDPHNFGAILRSAVALGADGVITMKQRSAPVTDTVVRVSAGASEHARIARVTNLARSLRELRDRGFQVIGLDAAGDPLPSIRQPTSEGHVLVVGSEGRGLRRLVRESCDRLARIELPGPIASLNASVAAGIALYEAARLREREREI